MELKKRKYKKKEVESFIKEIDASCDFKIAELNNQIRDLIKENDDLKMQNKVNESREELILATLARAESTAKKLEKNAKLQYELEVERIRKFAQKWDSYFQELKQKYPQNSDVKKAIGIKEELDLLVSKKTKAKDIIDKMDKAVNAKKKTFDPKKKIDEYISATSESGFNMDEVLNPGALKLEDLCKELGLAEENE